MHATDSRGIRRLRNRIWNRGRPFESSTRGRFCGDRSQVGNEEREHLFSADGNKPAGGMRTLEGAAGRTDRSSLATVVGRAVALAAAVIGLGMLGAPGAVAASGCENDHLRVGPSERLPDCRAYELVTPPAKTTRGTVNAGSEGRNANPGLPSLDGDRMLHAVEVFPLVDGEQPFPWHGSQTIYERTTAGWVGRTQLTLPLMPGWNTWLTAPSLQGMAGDLLTTAFRMHGSSAVPAVPVLPNEGSGPLGLYTYRHDGTGVKGWTGWLQNVDTQAVDQSIDFALLADDGSWMTRWGRYRGLYEGDPSAEQQLAGADGGSTIYHQYDPPHGPLTLVNECTGAAGENPTLIPARIGDGDPDDTLGVQECVEGNVTSARGAALGGNNGIGQGDRSTAGQSTTATSEDGRRQFFSSPDPSLPGQPQLFVRQVAPDGTATVRWLSRPDFFGQQFALLGRGAGFEGASRDGRFVYFRTDAPLTADDPNATGSPGPIMTGDASADSWDLYRYELPAGLDEDPENGELLRVSGGPTGTADPGVRNLGLSSSSAGSTARYISDDGRKAYFVTERPIGELDDPWNAGPAGGATQPAEAGSDRNLYLFDDTKTGTDRYRFIARLPGSTNTFSVGNCDTTGLVPGPPIARSGSGTVTSLTGRPWANCFRGTPSGDHVVFMSAGRLTSDDTDDATDIFIYEADQHSLVRVTAPPPGVSGYVCRDSSGAATEFCNGDLGFGGTVWGHNAYVALQRGWGGLRHANLAVGDDGEVSIFFQSLSRLVDEDVNDHWDVYMWRDGELSLVSPGDAEHHAYYSGNGIDGETVFIMTSQPIDPRELENDYDLYAVRAGGGFPPPVPPAPLCSVHAGECQRDETAPLPTSAATTTPGEATRPVARSVLRLGPLGPRVRRRAARTGVIPVRLRANRPGPVTLQARSRIVVKGRMTNRRVGLARARVRQAGSTTVRLRLNRAARLQLRRLGRLRIVIRATKPWTRPERVVIQLRRQSR